MIIRRNYKNTSCGSAYKILEKKEKTTDKEDIRLYLLKKGYKQETIKEVLECKTY